MALNDERKKLSDELYEKYGKPLEAEHWGEFVAISQDGKMVLGRTLLEVASKASDVLGRHNFVFKVGEKSVGRIR